MDDNVKKIAASAALKRKRPKAPLMWSEALAEAPWDPKKFPSPWERDFRVAYAQALVDRGKEFAKEPGGPGAPSPSGKTVHPRRLLSAPQVEFDEHDRRWKKSGEKSWNAWARKRLLE